MFDDQTRSPLGGIDYGPRAHDLCRFVTDPADDAIASMVRAARALSPDDRDTLRDRLDADDGYKLLTFATRRSVAGIRHSSLQEVREALQALALMTASRIDPRDVSVEFPLYAARPAPARGLT